jgi:Uma2 family endonuclease
MSYDEFLALGDDTTHAEWVGGEAILIMPPNNTHQAIVGFLYYLLVSFVNTLQLGAVRLAPFEMRLIPGQLSREPDILFAARDSLPRLTGQRLEGPADLVVEVVSEESATRDRRDKFQEYAQAGVREYWLIDPRPAQQQAIIYQRGEDGTYAATEPDAEGRLHSAVLRGLWLLPAWLWQEPLPDPLPLFLEMRGLGPEAVAALRAALRPAEE